MDKRFNGLRYSHTLECFVRESGEEVRMCQSAEQVFSILYQNLNQLVTRQYLLDLVLDAAPVSGNAANTNDLLNKCMIEITQLIGDNLKTIPRVGYLLTPDAADVEQKAYASVRKPPAGPGSYRRSNSTVLRELLFNSQWFASNFQMSQHAKLGSIVLLTALVLSFVDN